MSVSEKNNEVSARKADDLYVLTDEDIKRLHGVILEIYHDLYLFCEKHGLKLIAGGGTAIGSVRHQGFIPWDDDMDLNLTREDYEKFIRYFDEDLGDRYELTAPGYKKVCCFLMRVYKKNTTLLNMIDEASPYPTGIYIDITPIDYAPESRLAQRVKGKVSDGLRFLAYSVFWKQYKSKTLKEYLVGKGRKRYYQMRMALGTVFSFLPAEKWFSIFNSFIRHKKTRFVTVAAGRKGYCGELFPEETFFPVKKGVFENEEMYLYHDVDKYLTRLYGDYMKIPDESHREKHICIKLDFENGGQK